MSDGDPFIYRVKFTDIRVKPPADEASRARARRTRVCEQPGCDLEGACPAPKPGGRGRHWFCEDHAAAYNRSFDFFEGMSEAEAAAFLSAERYGHKRTWRMGAGPMGGRRAADALDARRWAGHGFFDLSGSVAGAGQAPRRSELQLRALRELDLDEAAAPAEIRARYAEYVRRFHPDANKGDRSSEHKLERVIRAGKLLKAAGLMKG